MKLLIINQHVRNHGDEAACFAFVLALMKKKEIEIELLYNCFDMKKNDIFTFDFENNVKHHLPLPLKVCDKFLIFISFFVPFFLFKIFCSRPALKNEIRLIEKADLIVNASGGVNIGPYKDWRYLWRLFAALKLRKPVAIYSTSIGPFPKSLLFKLLSIYTLKRVKFLSLRDEQSQKYASKLGIKHIAAVDTAFLHRSLPIKLPSQLQNLEKEKYVVIVPNEIYAWHKLFRNVDKKKVDRIYVKIIEGFLKKNLNVVLLPQRFGKDYDTRYFKKLSSQLSKTNKLEIVPEAFSCTIQQEIVNNSEFLVGARYHSIVFAIKGAVPFLALSYEHKMSHMLSLLNLQQHSISLKKLCDQKDSSQALQKIESLYQNRNATRETLILKKCQAQKIALDIFSEFELFIGKLSCSTPK